MSFLTRQELIQVLHDSFEDTSHIHVNKSVSGVQQGKDSVRVTTEDGSSYEGDLVVGADGVHSKVRAEMWSFHNSPELARVALREHKGTYTRSFPFYFISKPCKRKLASDC
jgi:2-polyprenyl-6-methoxyphenol hydroxylase-like FAD-dependent oxidoreductase